MSMDEVTEQNLAAVLGPDLMHMLKQKRLRGY
jgi:hypothetical protein